MKALTILIAVFSSVVFSYGQQRAVLVGTNSVVIQPTNFWSADASNARTGLGLGSAATNPASAFQPSSVALSNLAAGNGSALTNVTATIVGTNVSITNVSGLQAALDGKVSTNGSAAGLTGFPSAVLQTNSSLSLFPAGLLRTNGDGSGLTNLPIPAVASNVLSTIAIEKGGTGATNAAGARTALGATTVGANVFTAVDAAAARSAIGLGTASTNPSSAFQPSSAVLSNLANNDGSSLTNITAANIGTVALASNITGTAPLATNVTGVVAVSNGGTGGTNAATARSGIGLGTTNTLTIAGVVAENLTISSGGGITLQSTLSNAALFRTNIGLPWSGLTNIDASTFRSALELGTAATNPATAFQSSSSALTNLAANDGGALTNLRATNLVGIIPATNIETVTFSNVGGTLAISSGGTSATNAANARQNLGSTTVGDAVFIATNAAAARTAIGATTVGSSLFTLANPSAITFLRLNADNTASALSASDFRTALSLGTAATNPSSAFQPASSALTNLSTNNGVNLTNIPVAGVVGALSTNGSAAGLTNFPASLLTTNGNGAGLTNLTAANITGTVALASNVTGTIAISNGGSGATTAGGARTNLNLGWPALTNTNAATSLLGFTDNGQVVANMGTNVLRFTNTVIGFTDGDLTISNNKIMFGGSVRYDVEDGSFATGLGFTGNAAEETRTNLGLGWPALTNTTSSGFQAALFGTGTNPVLVNTNGEVVSPTNFWQEAPITTTFIESQPTTNSSTNISPSRLLHIHSLATNIVNTTNTIILPTNSLTFEGDMAMVVHKGPTNSLTQVRQAGSTNNLITLNKFNEAVEFTYYNNTWQFLETAAFTAPIYFSGTNASANAAASRTNLGLGATNNVVFNQVVAPDIAADNFTVEGAIYFTESLTNVGVTRTNLGLPLAALTNTSVTNFQKAIFYTNTAPSNIGGNLGTIAAWIEIVASNGVTYKIPAYTNVP